MKKNQTYKNLNYDFSDYAEEITGNALFEINGGAEIENSIEAQANAQVGDTVTNSKGETHVLTQGDITWAQEKLGETEEKNTPSNNEKKIQNTSSNLGNNTITTARTSSEYHGVPTEYWDSLDSQKQKSGFVIDREGAFIFGHSGIFVQTQNGKYAFFEVIGVSIDSNGISPDTIPGTTVKDKWGTDTIVLSCSENEFPSKEISETLNKPGYAGCLLRIFDTKNEMLSVLKKMGFDDMLCFNTNETQNTAIYNTAMELGNNFSSYNLLTNSCGIYAYKSLTLSETGINPVNQNAVIFPYSNSIPNILGSNIYMSNQTSKIVSLNGE